MRYYQVRKAQNDIIPVKAQAKPKGAFRSFAGAQRALVTYNLRRMRKASCEVQQWDARANKAIAMRPSD